MTIWSGIPLAITLLVQVPLILIWLLVIGDVVRRPDLPVWRKAAWIAGCTFVLPLLLVYLLIRPQAARSDLVAERSDPHARLVDAVMAHEAGRLDDARFAAATAQLRRLPSIDR